MGPYPRIENPKVKYIKDIQTSELSKSFERLYPYLSYKLRKSIDRLLKSLESYKKFVESLNRESEMQKNCKHQFGKPFEIRDGYYNQQCLKCHYIKKGKMPKSKKAKRNKQ